MESNSSSAPGNPVAEIQPRYGPTPLETEFGGPNLLQVIWQGRWIVLGITFLALATGFLYISNATPIFESTARVYVSKPVPVLSEDEVTGLAQSKNYINTQADLFTSTSVLKSALCKQIEVSEEEDENGGNKTVTILPLIYKIDNEVDEIDDLKTFIGIREKKPLDYLKEKCLDVSVGKDDDIISVSVLSPYKKEAANITNALVDAFIEYHDLKKASKTQDILKILEERKETSKELVDAEKALRDFLEENPQVYAAEDQALAAERLYRKHDALLLAKQESEEAKSALDVLEDAKGNAILLAGFLPQNSNAYLRSAEQDYLRQKRDLRQEIERLKLKLRNLQATITEECPLFLETTNQIEQLREEIVSVDRQWQRQLDEVYLAGLTSAKHRYQLAVECEQRAQADFDKYEKDAQDLRLKRNDLEALLTRRKNAVDLRTALDNRINEVGATERSGTLNIDVHERAEISDEPVSPKKARIMALALVLGLMLGSGLAFLKDWRDHRLRSSDEMATLMAAPVLGVLPHVRETDVITDTGRRVLLKPDSFDAEAYRAIRTSIKFNTLELDPRILLVTSPTSGDGKSTVTSNLAISMAQMGKRVLILDCDLRRSTQHLIFQVNGQASTSPATLPGVLADQDGLEHLIVPTGIDGLDLLPCLTGVSNPGEIINSHKFALLLKDLSQRYDLVLVDSPPVMPVADARVLGTLCDATIVVLRAEKSTRKAAELTRDGLESVGAQILGVVVNDVPKRKGGHGYYGYYGASKYYRYDKYHYRGSHKNGKGEGHDTSQSQHLLPHQTTREDRPTIDA